MKTAIGKRPLVRVDEIVAIKIDKMEKTSSLHPNVLFGRILHVENNYTKVVTSHEIISIFIFPPIAKTNVPLQIMFLITPKRYLFHQLANRP